MSNAQANLLDDPSAPDAAPAHAVRAHMPKGFAAFKKLFDARFDADTQTGPSTHLEDAYLAAAQGRDTWIFHEVGAEPQIIGGRARMIDAMSRSRACMVIDVSGLMRDAASSKG